MTQLTKIGTEIPDVAVKTGAGGMLSQAWSARAKLGAALLALAAYVYLLFLVKAIYVKHHRLNSIMEMVGETERMVQGVHRIDRELTAGLRLLDALPRDY